MQKIWGLLLLVAAIVAGAYSYQLLTKPTEFSNVLVYPQARKLAGFELTNHQGQPLTNQQLQGHWTLAFVGYTFCPDICPMTLATLSGAYPQLQSALPDGETLQIWFVSVDPKRDTTAQLANYVGYFEQPAIIGMTANHDRLFPFVRDLGLMYAISSSTDEDYRVDHSASIVLLNPAGQLVAMFKPAPSMDPNTMPLVSKTQLLADFSAVVAAVRR